MRNWLHISHSTKKTHLDRTRDKMKGERGACVFFFFFFIPPLAPVDLILIVWHWSNIPLCIADRCWLGVEEVVWQDRTHEGGWLGLLPTRDVSLIWMPFFFPFPWWNQTDGLVVHVGLPTLCLAHAALNVCQTMRWLFCALALVKRWELL